MTTPPSVLAPCPFCKYETHVDEKPNGIFTSYRVVCDNIPLYCGYQAKADNDRGKAIAMHNLICRPSATASQEPVAYALHNDETGYAAMVFFNKRQAERMSEHSDGFIKVVPLYSRPESSRGPIEPRAWLVDAPDAYFATVDSTTAERHRKERDVVTPLYASPPTDRAAEAVPADIKRRAGKLLQHAIPAAQADCLMDEKDSSIAITLNECEAVIQALLWQAHPSAPNAEAAETIRSDTLAKAQYVAIKLHGGSGYTVPRNHVWLGDSILSELDGLEEGDKITLTFKPVNISDEQYEQLGDLRGIKDEN